MYLIKMLVSLNKYDFEDTAPVLLVDTDASLS